MSFLVRVRLIGLHRVRLVRTRLTLELHVCYHLRSVVPLAHDRSLEAVKSRVDGSDRCLTRSVVDPRGQ